MTAETEKPTPVAKPEAAEGVEATANTLLSKKKKMMATSTTTTTTLVRHHTRYPGDFMVAGADHVETHEEEQAYHWAREYLFGDAHFTTHQFIERALSRGPKEIGCAFAASFLVSPLVSIIDKCIVQNISGTQQFVTAVSSATKEMVFTPKTFFGGLPFRLTFAVYFGTYAVANLSELTLDVNQVQEADERKNHKVLAASVANISLLAWRDSVFAREYGSRTRFMARPPTPLRSLGLFALRDSATMYATFYMAPRVASILHKEYSVDRNVAELSSALAIPMLTQVATAPFHIHAMDYYNNQKGTISGRFNVIRNEFSTVAFARGMRFLPAFGLGSFSNNKFRELFIRQTDEEKLFGRRLTRFLTRVNEARVNPKQAPPPVAPAGPVAPPNRGSTRRQQQQQTSRVA